MTVEATGAEIQATERWFLDRGLPFFIEGREIKVDDLVRGRSLVVLVLAYFGSLLLAVPADKSWAARLLYAVGGLLLLLAVWAVANLAPPATRPRTSPPGRASSRWRSSPSDLQPSSPYSTVTPTWCSSRCSPTSACCWWSSPQRSSTSAPSPAGR